MITLKWCKYDVMLLRLISNYYTIIYCNMIQYRLTIIIRTERVYNCVVYKYL